ncbi:short-chain dehydrogenase/reductase SDR [Coprinopsis sp. MPI-PUGE-AT-0042]|nr:short-chain dehydrogenase/reductase SDR [Coprinopsis sp. MPI-PUGE-AT-0042]
MTTPLTQRVLVVAGLGTGAGTGAATARLFAKKGYTIALIARGADSANKLADEITSAGGKAAPFPVSAYTPEHLATAWSDIHSRFPLPEYRIHAAVWNAGEAVWKSFLDITPEEIQRGVDTNIGGAFAFSREAILSFKENDVDETSGKRGALIFTGATSSVRGNVTTSLFAAGKHATRALSQSLAKEFGKQNIHVSHVIIDGGIITDRSKKFKNDAEWETNENVRLNPESIAESYLYLAEQDRSAWTWELDLRPAHEKW